jgi:exonuclease VII small subunit
MTETRFDFDNFIEEITQDIDKMSSNKEIRKNIIKYNYNNKKISDVKKKLETLQKEIDENKNDEENSEELISDTQFINYLKELDELKKNLNNSLKLHEAIEIYKNSIIKIKQCKDYLENQKTEVINID